jgi:hypothetical protein
VTAGGLRAGLAPSGNTVLNGSGKLRPQRRGNPRLDSARGVVRPSKLLRQCPSLSTAHHPPA